MPRRGRPLERDRRPEMRRGRTAKIWLLGRLLGSCMLVTALSLLLVYLLLRVVELNIL